MFGFLGIYPGVLGAFKEPTKNMRQVMTVTVSMSMCLILFFETCGKPQIDSSQRYWRWVQINILL